MLEHMLASDAAHAQVTLCGKGQPLGRSTDADNFSRPFVMTPQQSGTSGVLHECPNALM